MLHDWGVIAAAFGYIGFLFLVASYGERLSPTPARPRRRADLSAVAGDLLHVVDVLRLGRLRDPHRVDFLAIYVGPILMIGFCTPLLRRVIQLAKSQNITSIADFIAARYGKSQAVAATVAVIAIVGSVPYIALQLKAVASSLETILERRPGLLLDSDHRRHRADRDAGDGGVRGAVRHPPDRRDRTPARPDAGGRDRIDRQAGGFHRRRRVRHVLDVRPVELIERAMKTPEAVRAIDYTPSIGNFLTMTLLSFCAIMLLPRQFHVSVVENSSDAEVGRARWLFPLYLVAINLFVIPIALAGLMTFPFGAVDSDMYVLALPMEANAPLLSVVVFVGGLSAATAMVIVGMRRAVDHGVERYRGAAGAAAQSGTARAARRISATSCSGSAALRFSPSW